MTSLSQSTPEQIFAFEVAYMTGANLKICARIAGVGTPCGAYMRAKKLGLARLSRQRKLFSGLPSKADKAWQRMSDYLSRQK